MQGRNARRRDPPAREACDLGGVALFDRDRVSIRRLEIDGRTLDQTESEAGVQQYAIEQGGDGVLSFRGGIPHRVLLLVQIGFVIALLVTARRVARSTP